LGEWAWPPEGGVVSGSAHPRRDVGRFITLITIIIVTMGIFLFGGGDSLRMTPRHLLFWGDFYLIFTPDVISFSFYSGPYLGFSFAPSKPTKPSIFKEILNWVASNERNFPLFSESGGRSFLLRFAGIGLRVTSPVVSS
jgi:hypothetical protein